MPVWKEVLDRIDDRFFSFPFKIFPVSKWEVDMLKVTPTRLHGHQKLPRVPYQFSFGSRSIPPWARWHMSQIWFVGIVRIWRGMKMDSISAPKVAELLWYYRVGLPLFSCAIEDTLSESSFLVPEWIFHVAFKKWPQPMQDRHVANLRENLINFCQNREPSIVQ